MNFTSHPYQIQTQNFMLLVYFDVKHVEKYVFSLFQVFETLKNFGK